MASSQLARSGSPDALAQQQRLQRAGQFVRHHWVALLGGAIFLAALLGGLFAPVISPYDPALQDVPARLQGPSAAHLLGTDDLGRDTLSRVLWGARPIMLVGIVSVALSVLAGGLVGLLAGYFGGWVDTVISAFVDVVLSFPIMLLAILIVTTLGPSLGTTIVAVAFAQVPIFARLVRSLVLSIRGYEYVQAARALGLPQLRIMLRHIVPNLIGPTVVQATAALALAIGYSSALSFLGLGVQPPTADWGLMVSDGRRLIFSDPQVPFIPGVAITLTVLGLNFLGDGIRDWLDPTTK